jgi:ATP-dependent DNA helicase DinG
MLDVNDFFAPKTGYIASVKKNFAPREGQPDLAKLILKAAAKQKHVLGEAPTGFGKSFAALVPAIIEAVERKKRIVVSTETIALQDQYLGKDLPLLQRALREHGIEFTFAAAKGRSNYICALKAFDEAPKTGLTPLQQWAQKQHIPDNSGDVGSIDFDFDIQEWREVGADEDCERKACSFYGDGAAGETQCFVFKARGKMLDADIVVTNHTLFLLDAELEGHPLLGDYDMAIIDEAHSLPEKAQDCWGKELRRKTLSRTTSFLAKMLKRNGVDGFFTPNDYEVIERHEKQIFNALREVKETKIFDNLTDEQRTDLSVALGDCADFFKALRKDLRKLASGETEKSGKTAAIETACDKLNTLVGLLRSVTGDNIDPEHKDNWLSYVDASWSHKKKSWQRSIHLKPINPAPLIRAYLLDIVPTIIFISATLKVNGSFNFIRSELGLQADEFYEFTGDAVFDYQEQVRYHFPKDLPDAKDPQYLPAMIDEIVKLVTATDGKALILFTNVTHMREVYEAVSRRVKFDCYIQGQAPKNALLDLFQEDVHSCLFATRSFFTGIDVPGEALSLVVLTKAPFRVPSDPLFKAQCDKIEEAGRSSFRELSLPRMLFDVKQVFGRLIRTTEDTGVFALLDSRALNSGYASRIMRTLPEARKFKL